MEALCAECGIEINRPPSGFKRNGNKVFCCQSHHYSYYKNNPTYRMKNRKYTEEQQEYVRTHYLGTCNSARQISQDLNISYKHIFYIIKKCGVSRGGLKKNGRPWTEKEDSRLRDEITNLSILTIANKHKRSPTSIKGRLQDLNISRKGRDGWYNGRDICDIFGVTSMWLTRRIRDGLIQAEQRGNNWYITRDNLINFVRENPHDIDGRKLDIFYFIELLVGIDTKINIKEPEMKSTPYIKRHPTAFGTFCKEQIKLGKCKTVTEAAKLWKSYKVSIDKDKIK